MKNDDTIEDETDRAILQLQIEQMPVTADVISRETKNDQELKLVYNALQSGGTLENTTFKNKDHEFTIENGCIFRGIRVVIPKTLRRKILDELHEAHIGIVKMKELARQYCWWNGIDTDIEEMARSCKGCCIIQNAPNKAPVHPWTIPNTPWNRVHVDFAGPFMGWYFLVVVDAHTKWLEVIQMKSITSQKTINVLRDIFARFGLPITIVTDNGTSFTSEEFQLFLRANGIKHKLTSPAHPSTNGQAERYVQTVKKSLKAMADEPGDIHLKVCRFLMQYRKAKNATTQRSPAELMLKGTLKTKLDLIKRDFVSEQRDRQFEKSNIFRKLMREFVIGETVQVLSYRAGGDKWNFGKIVDRDGLLHYRILVNGQVWRRHVDQIRSCNVIQPDEEIVPPVTLASEKFNGRQDDSPKTPIQLQTFDGGHSEERDSEMPESSTALPISEDDPNTNESCVRRRSLLRQSLSQSVPSGADHIPGEVHPTQKTPENNVTSSPSNFVPRRSTRIRRAPIRMDL